MRQEKRKEITKKKIPTSTFRISIQKGFSKATTREIANMEKKKKILIIEDEEDIAKLISHMLTSTGYDIEISYDANDALNKIFKPMKCDLVLLDISIPVMDGWEFLEIIRSNEETKNIPVMIITARTGIRSRTLALQRGAQDFITKPFTRKNLLERVKNLLTEHQPNKVD